MITAEQKQLRKRYLGSSDASAVMGLDPYRSAADVWLDKTGADSGFDGNDATEAGNYLEPAMLAWAEKQLGPLTRDVFIVHPSGELCANLDARTASGQIVEAKTTGIVGPRNAAFGEVLDGPDVELPDSVIVQTHHQFANCREVLVAWVPVLIGGEGFRMYRVDRNEELVAEIETRGVDFMRRFVRTGERPSDFKPSLEVLKRIRRTPNKTIDVSDNIVADFLAARAAKKTAEEEFEDAQRDLIAALGDAEAGKYAAGEVTYMQTSRKGYEVAPTVFRTLRVKPAKN